MKIIYLINLNSAYELYTLKPISRPCNDIFSHNFVRYILNSSMRTSRADESRTLKISIQMWTALVDTVQHFPVQTADRNALKANGATASFFIKKLVDSLAALGEITRARRQVRLATQSAAQ